MHALRRRRKPRMRARREGFSSSTESGVQIMVSRAARKSPRAKTVPRRRHGSSSSRPRTVSGFICCLPSCCQPPVMWRRRRERDSLGFVSLAFGAGSSGVTWENCRCVEHRPHSTAPAVPNEIQPTHNTTRLGPQGGEGTRGGQVGNLRDTGAVRVRHIHVLGILPCPNAVDRAISSTSNRAL